MMRLKDFLPPRDHAAFLAALGDIVLALLSVALLLAVVTATSGGP